MDTISTILLFVVIAVMALVIIVLVVWVSKLSFQLKRLSDAVFSGGIQHSQQSQQIRQGCDSRSGLDQSAQGNGVSHQRQPMDAGLKCRERQDGSSWANQMRQAGNPRTGWAGGVEDAASSPQGHQQQASADQDAEMDFFERYKQHDDPNSTGGFGRRKPSIPFGQDKTIPSGWDVYAAGAADFDAEPDSIDFSRVAGYRNVLNR